MTEPGENQTAADPSTAPELRRGTLRAIPSAIWALGLTSMFMDISSEMIHSLLPVFLVSVLGASAVTVGLVEGIAEAAASITKIFSGAASDYLGKRKSLAVLGYGMSTAVKPLFALAATPAWVLAARFLDRIGKGIRGAPRDALVGDLAPLALRGAAYGLRQSLDTIGAFLGPLLAILLMAISGDNYRVVFWIAVLPAVVSVALLTVGVEEKASAPERTSRREKTSTREKTGPRRGTQSVPRLAELRRLAAPYWWLIAISSVFTLARFSEAFLVLRATDAGLGVAFVPVVLIVMNVVYAVAAYPAGHVSDRLGRWRMAAIGFGVLVAADVILAFASGVAGVLIGVAFWGLHMGLTQGIFAALVADTTPAELRGTSFGIFNLATGVAALIASLGAGALWEVYGPPAAFLAGAALVVVALAVMLGRRAFGRVD